MYVRTVSPGGRVQLRVPFVVGIRRRGIGQPPGTTPPPWYMNLPMASDIAYEFGSPTSTFNELLQTAGLQTPPALPAQRPSAPGFQPPLAPQTAGAMVTWSPDVAAEAAAQRGQQFALDVSYQQAENAPDSGGAPPGTPPGSGFPWLLVGGITVGGLWLLSKSGRRR